MFCSFSEIDTPALLIEKSILEKNILRMQNLANTRNIKLRPHIKTHKIPEIAKLQIDAGAQGIAVAKISEAETMADYGFLDIQIANIIVGKKKVERLRILREKLNSLSVATDSFEAVDDIAKAFKNSLLPLKVLIKVDAGFHRCGLESKEAILKLSKYILDKPGLTFEGLMTHAGQAYLAGSIREIEQIGYHEANVMIQIAEYLRKNGVEVLQISVGSTPTACYSSKIEGITELRVGNYVYFDMIQVALGTSKITDCALSILSTIVSIPSLDRMIIDAGSKSLSLDKGAHSKSMLDSYGYIIGKNSKIVRLSEEHGVVDILNEDFSTAEKIRIIPNHACAVSNLFDKAYLVDGKEIIDEFNIPCRGKST
jgi:D-serine deaminase-like pyridoxal phosphate-dependent protein